MARPRKVSDEDEVGPMDDKTFKSFLKKIDLAQVEVEEAAEATKTARSELSAIWKDFKKAGGKPETMREVMRLRRMDEGDLVQHEEDRKQYAAWMKLPLYTQPDMFEEDPPRPKAAPAADEPIIAKPKRGKATVENVTGSPLN